MPVTWEAEAGGSYVPAQLEQLSAQIKDTGAEEVAQ